MVSVPKHGSWVAHPIQDRPAIPRPTLLLVADLYLLGLLVFLARWLVGSLLDPASLSDPSSAPPVIMDAQLDVARATLAFGLPLVLAAVTLFRLRFPERTGWPWTPLLASWIGLAFAETLIASPDFTATTFVVGVPPALLIAAHQTYLRRVSGQPPLAPPWTRRRRVLTVIVGLAVAIWVAAYVILAVVSIRDLFGPLSPEFFPGAPV